jgi:hypothetical protein
VLVVAGIERRENEREVVPGRKAGQKGVNLVQDEL